LVTNINISPETFVSTSLENQIQKISNTYYASLILLIITWKVQQTETIVSIFYFFKQSIHRLTCLSPIWLPQSKFLQKSLTFLQIRFTSLMEWLLCYGVQDRFPRLHFTRASSSNIHQTNTIFLCHPNSTRTPGGWIPKCLGLAWQRTWFGYCGESLCKASQFHRRNIGL